MSELPKDTIFMWIQKNKNYRATSLLTGAGFEDRDEGGQKERKKTLSGKCIDQANPLVHFKVIKFN